jgi:hypothetical protein
MDEPLCESNNGVIETALFMNGVIEEWFIGG